ncbi:hypothetical protein Bbelb_254710 [Branchiostoma belcheri]|nr:hypothetical protein Bbelb_254710 [Branchiostoma belcheri]
MCFIRSTSGISGVFIQDVHLGEELPVLGGGAYAACDFRGQKAVILFSRASHSGTLIPCPARLLRVFRDMADVTNGTSICTACSNTVDATRTFCDHPEYAPPQRRRREQAIEDLTSAAKQAAEEIVTQFEAFPLDLVTRSNDIRVKYETIFKAFAKCHKGYSHTNSMTNEEISNLDFSIKHFLAKYRELFPTSSVSVKMHLLEEHVIPWIRCWGVGFSRGARGGTGPCRFQSDQPINQLHPGCGETAQVHTGNPSATGASRETGWCACTKEKKEKCTNVVI